MNINQTKSAAFIGEAMIELSVDKEDEKAGLSVAGDVYNVAHYFVQGGGKASFISRIGNDNFSDMLQQRFQKSGIQTDLIARDETRTIGIYAIETDDKGERSFVYWRENSAARKLFQNDTQPKLSDLDAFELIYYSGITLAIMSMSARESLFAYLDKRRENGAIVAFDSNYRPKLWESENQAREVISRAWSLCDVALPSVDDEMALFGEKRDEDVLHRIQNAGPKYGALKCGAKGPLLISGADAPNLTPIDPSLIKDTTAAGDSFNGAFLASWLRDQNDKKAAEAGHHVASQVIQKRGAIVDIS